MLLKYHNITKDDKHIFANEKDLQWYMLLECENDDIIKIFKGDEKSPFFNGTVREYGKKYVLGGYVYK